uniref:Uncharacterized protein n=1 Tax=Lactuca sativa TaxID=4236 RepID=A0A9R1VKK1_LACSA|nr:hypothetical protein LSAT_V11C500288690 [Lactuca sativa]
MVSHRIDVGFQTSGSNFPFPTPSPPSATATNSIDDFQAPKEPKKFGWQSSSTAFVCSSIIAIMAPINVNLPKKEVPQVTCECERHFGTQFGGMDQILLGIKFGMEPEEAISKVKTLCDVEALCVSFAGAHESSNPTLAVKVFIRLPKMMAWHE